MTFTRRELAAAVAAGAAALGRAAATQAPNQGAAPADARKQADIRVREDGQALAKYHVPMRAAPAFIFEA